MGKSLFADLCMKRGRFHSQIRVPPREVSFVSGKAGPRNFVLYFPNFFNLIGVNHDAQRHPPGAELDESQATLERC